MFPPAPKHQLRGNVSNAALPSDFREVLQQRLGELERQLLRKVAELEEEKSLLHNETSAHRQKTESALDALLQRVTELERGECPVLCLFLCRPLADVPAGSSTPCLGSWLQYRESWAQSMRRAGREGAGSMAQFPDEATWVREWSLLDLCLLTLLPGCWDGR